RDFSTLVEHATDMIVRFDTDLRHIYCNPAVEDQLGAPAHALIGKTPLEAGGPRAQAESVELSLRTTLETGKEQEVEQSFPFPSGIKHFLTHIVPERDEQGRIQSLLAITRDITERKQAEKALRISEGQKDAILNGITANVAFVDKDLRLLWVNAAAAKSVNRSPAEMIGQTCYAFWADPAKPCQNCPTLKAFQTKQTEHALMYTPDGRVWDERGEPVFDEKGDVIGVVEIAQDITEIKQAEDLLQQTRQNYEAFFNTIDDFLFVLDEQGNVIHTNTTVTDRLGYTNEELSGKSVLMVHPPERRAEAGRIVGEMLSGAVEFCPVPIVTKSGVQIPVETRVSHGFWDGKAVIFGVTKDISKVKLSEEKFSKLFHINPSACGLSDLNNRQYIEVNEAFYTLFGFQKDEVIGKTATELGILTAEAIRTILLNADSNGNVSNAEADLKAKNGDIKHVLLSSENIHVQEKKYRFTVVHDITARKQAEEALRESEERFALAIGGTGAGLWDWDMVNDQVVYSTQWKRMLGYDDHEVENSFSGWKNLWHPDDQIRIEEAIEDYLAGKTSHYEIIHRLRHKDGAWRWILCRGDIVNDAQGKPLRWVGTNMDITERKQAEEALRESEETLRSQIENSFDVIFTLNKEGEFLFVSPAWERHFGYPVSEVIGKSFAPFVHPDDIAPLSEYLKRVLSAGQSETSPAYRVKHADGSWRSFIANGTTYVDAKGERRFIGVGHDITESKRAEEALRESEERFRMLLHSTGEAIYGLDMQGKCTFANAACCRILGYGSPEFFIGKNMHDLIHHSHKDGTSFAVADCLIFNAFRKGQKTHVDDEVLWKADGTSFPAEYWSYPILREGIIEGAVVTFIDITERKELEERIRQVRGDLLFAVSHDLKSPLQALHQTQEMLNMLTPGEGLARFQEYSEIWRRNLKRLERMINNLMDSQRAEEGRFPLLLAPSDPMELVKRVVEDSQGYALSSAVTFDLKLQPMPEGSCDEEALSRVVENLLTNAVKFSPKGGKVEVRLGMEENILLLEVEDHGLGIPAQEQSQLFQPFQRGSSAHEKRIPGTGLGLYVCRRIVEEHGGSISLTSEEGKGTIVTVRLPWGGIIGT
ncbi:MAG: PAS domain S-box protein, partial [bacterium]